MAKTTSRTERTKPMKISHQALALGMLNSQAIRLPVQKPEPGKGTATNKTKAHWPYLTYLSAALPLVRSKIQLKNLLKKLNLALKALTTGPKSFKTAKVAKPLPSKRQSREQSRYYFRRYCHLKNSLKH